MIGKITTKQLRESQKRMRPVSSADALEVSEELLAWAVLHNHPAAALSAMRVVLEMTDVMATEYFDAQTMH